MSERGGLPGGRSGPRDHPDLQRGRERPAHHRPGPRARCPRSTSSSPTTTARTAPARSPTSWPPPTTTSTCCTAPASRASARRTWPASPGPGTRLRRGGGDGRRRLARPRGAAQAARRAARRRRRCSAPATCRGGKVLNWPLHRLLLSRGGNLYIRMALGMPVKDATGGYRAYRMPVLDKIDVDTVASQGYCFQVELAWRAYRHGFRVAEVPITFAERERGASKMSSAIVTRGAVAGHRVGCARRAGLALPVRRPRRVDRASDRRRRDHAPSALGDRRRSLVLVRGRRDRGASSASARSIGLGWTAGCSCWPRPSSAAGCCAGRAAAPGGRSGPPPRPAARPATQATDALVGLLGGVCCWRARVRLAASSALLLSLPPARRLARRRRASVPPSAGCRRRWPVTCSGRGGCGSATATRRRAEPSPRRPAPPASRAPPGEVIEGEIVD